MFDLALEPLGKKNLRSFYRSTNLDLIATDLVHIAALQLLVVSFADRCATMDKFTKLIS